MTEFRIKLAKEINRTKAALCIGLDPHVDLLPYSVPRSASGILDFSKAVVEATYYYACCYKPNFAFWLRWGVFGLSALEDLIEYLKTYDVPVIMDMKVGDIDTSAVQYAVFVRDILQVDAVTVNPYMGTDAISPFVRKQIFTFVLTRTSNASAAAIQSQIVNGKTVAESVANIALSCGDKDTIGFVVGGNDVPQLTKLRQKYSDILFLVPGIGAQGADVEEVLKASCYASGSTLINVGRSIIHASQHGHFARECKRAARRYYEMLKF